MTCIVQVALPVPRIVTPPSVTGSVHYGAPEAIKKSGTMTTASLRIMTGNASGGSNRVVESKTKNGYYVVSPEGMKVPVDKLVFIALQKFILLHRELHGSVTIHFAQGGIRGVEDRSVYEK
jgi:hypothetical protein